MKAGVIDPTKVTRTALQNAASIAALLLTTEALVVEIPEPKSAPAGGQRRRHGRHVLVVASTSMQQQKAPSFGWGPFTFEQIPFPCTEPGSALSSTSPGVANLRNHGRNARRGLWPQGTKPRRYPFRWDGEPRPAAVEADLHVR